MTQYKIFRKEGSMMQFVCDGTKHHGVIFEHNPHWVIAEFGRSEEEKEVVDLGSCDQTSCSEWTPVHNLLRLPTFILKQKGIRNRYWGFGSGYITLPNGTHVLVSGYSNTYTDERHSATTLKKGEEIIVAFKEGRETHRYRLSNAEDEGLILVALEES